MGAYAGRSQPRLPHSYCRSAEISRSVIPGLMGRIAANCAAIEALTALRTNSTSSYSLIVRNEASSGRISAYEVPTGNALAVFNQASGCVELESPPAVGISV